jgi:hypothetical protein
MKTRYLIGGPFDGRPAERGRPTAFDVDGAVYMMQPNGDFAYQGEQAWPCRGCGALITPDPGDILRACPLCGESHEPGRQPHGSGRPSVPDAENPS